MFKMRALLHVIQRDSTSRCAVVTCMTSQVAQNALTLTYYLFTKGDNPACYLCLINTFGKHNKRI